MPLPATKNDLVLFTCTTDGSVPYELKEKVHRRPGDPYTERVLDYDRLWFNTYWQWTNMNPTWYYENGFHNYSIEPKCTTRLEIRIPFDQ